MQMQGFHCLQHRMRVTGSCFLTSMKPLDAGQAAATDRYYTNVGERP